MSHWEETPGKTQDTFERLCLPVGLGTPPVLGTPPGLGTSLGWPGNASGSPPEELKEGAGDRNAWASLLKLLPT